MKKINRLKFILIFIILGILLFLFYNSYSFANDEIVYIDTHEIDPKYHSIICDMIEPNRYKEVSVEEAFKMGYRRCQLCSPPMSDKEKKVREEEFEKRLEEARELRHSMEIYSSNEINNEISNSTTNEINKQYNLNDENSDSKESLLLLITVVVLIIICLSITYYIINEIHRRKYIKENKAINMDDYEMNNEKKQLTQDTNIAEKKNDIQNTQTSSQINFPMAWYGFWIYFRFPFGFIVTALSILNSLLLTFDHFDEIALGLTLFNIGYLIFFIFTYIEVKNRRKHTVKLITILCIVDGITGTLSQLLVDIFKNGFDIANCCMVAVISTVFTILNYIYFNKRRCLFKN